MRTTSFFAFLGVSLAAHAGVFGVLSRQRGARAAAEATSPDWAGRTGDTFEVPEQAEEVPAEPGAWAPAGAAGAPGAAAPAGSPGAAGAGMDAAEGLRASGGPARRRGRGAKGGAGVAAGSAAGPAGGAAASAASAALFGAVGERGAADLATTFTRSFPQAASTDHVWVSAPFGGAGEADVVLGIDPSGALTQVRVEGAPSPALRAGITRTVALIRARTFTAAGAQTRLHVTASVAQDQVHDGLHGDVFAIGGSFAGGEGSAFFALAIGRRIDVRVRAR